MTTIVYNHKDQEIAFDSRSVHGNIIITDSAIKMEIHNDVVFFLAGCTSDFEMLISRYFSDKKKSRVDAECFTYDNGVFYKAGVDSCGIFWRQQLTNNDTTGSGSIFALAAMDFGLNAKQAVEYAATRDIYTGGKVNVFKASKLNELKV